MTNRSNYNIEDFTQDNYEKLLVLAKSKYEFIKYDDIKNLKDNTVLWRHDVDYSMHRALRLAEIETKHNCSATYFLYLHSTLYNLLEKEIFEIVNRIIGLGHEIGLHFDPSFYDLKINETGRLAVNLGFEKKLLEDLFQKEIKVYSFHNPDAGGWMVYEEYITAGMISTYSKYIKDNFLYCSDSDGHWRHKRLEDVLGWNEKRLHILTHPVWWVPEEMTPRSRVSRCIEGRTKKFFQKYDKNLKDLGRENVK